MKKFLFYFAVAGWMLGLLVHLLSLLGFDVTESISFVWLLHLGLFVVWIPAVLLFKNSEKIKADQESTRSRKMGSNDLFKIAFKQIPKWLKIIAYAGFFLRSHQFYIIWDYQRRQCQNGRRPIYIT